jgi:nicotinamide mononucleotide transporter
MWFMAKRRIENWIFWIIGDFICIPMMIYKELGITSVQYLVFTIMAILGYASWKKVIKKKSTIKS